MNIAIFADLHGRVLLCFKLCARWQHETGEKIDLILQAGDLGAYPDLSRLDRATIKHMRADSTEIGFSEDFVNIRDEVAEVLAQTDCPMLFVRGNHEDHRWLDNLEQQHSGAIFPVDAYQRIFCMKTGLVHTFEADGTSISILGIGRIGPLPGEMDETLDKYIQAYELERIYGEQALEFDLLLTHDVALNALAPNYGLEEIRLLLDTHQPPYHFHGHTEAAFTQRLDANGETQVIKLSDLHWDKTTPNLDLEHGGMGILRWHGQGDHRFELVDAAWWHEYNARSWRDL